MKRPHSLGDLQLAILRVLWEHREATVAEVHEALLAERGLAPTTIATMLSKMEKKGVVAHHSEGRRYIYRALVSEHEVKRSMVRDLTQRLFSGNAAALVSHLLAEEELKATDLDRLKQRLAKLPPEEGP